MERVGDPCDPRLFRIANAGQGRFQDDPVVLQRDRQSGGGPYSRGERVRVGGLDVEHVDDPPGRQVGQPDPHRVAVRFRRQVQHHQGTIIRLTRSALPAPHADHVGIHPGAADILSHLVDDEDVQVVEGNPREQAERLTEHFRVGLHEILRKHQPHGVGFFVRVFKNGDAEQDGQARQDDAGRRGRSTVPGRIYACSGRPGACRIRRRASCKVPIRPVPGRPCGALPG